MFSRGDKLGGPLSLAARPFCGADIFGYVGSNNPIAAYQEFGTKTIPPRSFLGVLLFGFLAG
jgi:hypothetical protein